jgi:hypothetical protein
MTSSNPTQECWNFNIGRTSQRRTQCDPEPHCMAHILVFKAGQVNELARIGSPMWTQSENVRFVLLPKSYSPQVTGS